MVKIMKETTLASRSLYTLQLKRKLEKRFFNYYQPAYIDTIFAENKTYLL